MLIGDDIVTTYSIDKCLVISLKDSIGNAISNVEVVVNLNGVKKLTTDGNGQVKISTNDLDPNIYIARITFNGTEVFDISSKDVKIIVNKATLKITAKKKTFKVKTKTKKYTITLKNNVGKSINKAKLTLKVKGKIYKATTNSKGQACFKITNLKKKRTFKAIITYNGNKYYNKVTNKVKITVK